MTGTATPKWLDAFGIDPAFTQARWRRGRKVGRTIYVQQGPEPSDDDPLIGVMDTPELAALVVDAVNAY